MDNILMIYNIKYQSELLEDLRRADQFNDTDFAKEFERDFSIRFPELEV